MVNWVEVRTKLPTEKTDEQKVLRDELYNEFDPNNNGYLSLAEVDKGCRDVLQLYDLFNAKPVIMRAFQSAKSISKVESIHGPDYIERSEFRLLLVYLRTYYELYDFYETINTDDENRLSYNEFEKAIPQFQQRWNIGSFDVKTEFDAIDTNKSGSILFSEFVAWAYQKQIDNDHE